MPEGYSGRTDSSMVGPRFGGSTPPPSFMSHKIIVVGDVHGRSDWEKVLEKEPDFDKFVFIGDYFDSFNIHSEKIYENFRKILNFKLTNLEKVVLLCGNHDYHYLEFTPDRYSGWQAPTALALNNIIEKAISDGLILGAYSHEDILFTHAGLSDEWSKAHGVKFAEEINKSLMEKPEIFEFFRGDYSHCGNHVLQSPIWVRPDALMSSLPTGLRQVVGHTTSDKILERNGVWFIDAPESKEYLSIEDGIINIKKI